MWFDSSWWPERLYLPHYHVCLSTSFWSIKGERKCTKNNLCSNNITLLNWPNILGTLWKKHQIKLQSGEKFCGALTFTSAAILSIANPSTVSCKEKWTWANKSKQTLKFISENLNQLFSYPPNRMNVWRHVLMCFCVWGRSSSSFGFYLDEPWYEEAALVAVVKLLPVVLDKLPGGFPAVFTASCHAADYWHGVLRTNLFLSGRRTREVSWGEHGSESHRLERNLCHWTKKLKLDLNF